MKYVLNKRMVRECGVGFVVVCIILGMFLSLIFFVAFTFERLVGLTMQHTPVSQVSSQSAAVEPVRGSQEVFEPSQTDVMAGGVNQVRAKHGRASLVTNPVLVRGAEARAKELCDLNQWSHEGYIEAFDRLDYSYYRMGENLAYGFDGPEATVTGWENSPTHFDNMINAEFTEQGIGSYVCASFQGREQVTISVNYFGRPL